MSGIDDLIEQMKRDEVEDAEKAKPIKYAKLRGIYPQRVYKAIRDGKLTPERCLCGSWVISIAEADEVFKIGKHRGKPAVDSLDQGDD